MERICAPFHTKELQHTTAHTTSTMNKTKQVKEGWGKYWNFRWSYITQKPFYLYGNSLDRVHGILEWVGRVVKGAPLHYIQSSEGSEKGLCSAMKIRYGLTVPNICYTEVQREKPPEVLGYLQNCRFYYEA